jgi:hypothetical protein
MAVATTIVQPSTRVFVTPSSTTGSMEKQLASASNHQGLTNKPGKAANTHRTSSNVVSAKHVHRAPVLQHKDEGLSVSTLRKIKRRLFLEAVNSDTHHHHQLRIESAPRKQRTNNSAHTCSGKENDMECG